MFIITVSSGSLAEYVKAEPKRILPLIFYDLSLNIQQTHLLSVFVLLRPKSLTLRKRITVCCHFHDEFVNV